MSISIELESRIAKKVARVGGALSTNTIVDRFSGNWVNRGIFTGFLIVTWPWFVCLIFAQITLREFPVERWSIVRKSGGWLILSWSVIIIYLEKVTDVQMIIWFPETNILLFISKSYSWVQKMTNLRHFTTMKLFFSNEKVGQT